MHVALFVFLLLNLLHGHAVFIIINASGLARELADSSYHVVLDIAAGWWGWSLHEVSDGKADEHEDGNEHSPIEGAHVQSASCRR